MLCAVDHIFNLLCAFNSLQPMKKFGFSVASRVTGLLQIRPSGSGDENEGSYTLWKTAIVTVWHEKLAGVYFCGLVIFLCFAGTIF